jgi:hypothetical protein
MTGSGRELPATSCGMSAGWARCLSRKLAGSLTVARELLERGWTPTVADVADEAVVSRATGVPLLPVTRASPP